MLGLTAALSGHVAPAKGGLQGARTPVPRAVESCVSHDRIYFEPGDERVMLDAADVTLVRDAMARMYPLIDRDGLLPSEVILWQRRSGELLYVAVITNPLRAADLCFQAIFAANRFGITHQLRSKYFFPDAQQPQ